MIQRKRKSRCKERQMIRRKKVDEETVTVKVKEGRYSYSVDVDMLHKEKDKLSGLSLRENYTDRATAACRQS
jgi:hypothetical protein